jgi:hypothetical protein
MVVKEIEDVLWAYDQFPRDRKSGELLSVEDAFYRLKVAMSCGSDRKVTRIAKCFQPQRSEGFPDYQINVSRAQYDEMLGNYVSNCVAFLGNPLFVNFIKSSFRFEEGLTNSDLWSLNGRLADELFEFTFDLDKPDSRDPRVFAASERILRYSIPYNKKFDTLRRYVLENNAFGFRSRIESADNVSEPDLSEECLW